LHDEQVRGLTLVAYASGKRSWHLFYRNSERRQRNAKIATYPATGVEAARTLALQWLADVSRGIDPVVVRKAASDKRTVSALAKWFVEHHAKKKLKTSTFREYERLLDKHILPAFGGEKIDRVTHAMVEAFHHRLSDTPRQANQAAAVLHRMFNDAIKLGWRTDNVNPVRGIQKFRENARRRYLEKSEFSRLWDVLRNESISYHETDGVLAIQLLLLTGRRKGEIVNLRWNEIDFADGIMKLKDSKVGARDYQLATSVIALLRDEYDKRIEELQTSAELQSEAEAQLQTQFVIRGQGGKGPLAGLQNIWERLRSKADLNDVRLHDLRHSYASVAIDQGMDLARVKELLGHRDIGTTQRYVHLYRDAVTQTVNAVETGLMEALRGRPSAIAQP
jgi:integrase